MFAEKVIITYNNGKSYTCKSSTDIEILTSLIASAKKSSSGEVVFVNSSGRVDNFNIQDVVCLQFHKSCGTISWWTNNNVAPHKRTKSPHKR